MKKFKFNLQKVIDVKESIEKKKMFELSEAERQVVIEKEKLNTLLKKSIWHRNMYDKRKSESPMSASEANHFIKYINKLSNDIQLQKHIILQKTRESDKRRSDLIDTVKDKKILEKLKEHKFSDYKQDILRQEQNFLDEVGAVRKTREGLIKV